MSYANANSPASAVQSPGADCTKYEKKLSFVYHDSN